MSRILLAGGFLYDGTGGVPFPADILIGNDKILQVEPAGKAVFPGAEKKDLTGLSVSPGWIDPHAHSDASLLAAPEAFGKISQGITTEISGNCGLSAFPILTDEVREHLRILYSSYGIEPDWTDFRSYATALAARQPAVNAVFLCGHNTLRANIAGYRQQELTDAQLTAMNALLTETLKQGVRGLSTGLLYTPGCFADENELLTLLRTAAAHGGVYATHLRNEGDRLEEAVQEAISLAERSGAALQISHLKTALPRNWHKLESVLSVIQAAQQRGVSVHADRYPYTFSQTSLSIVLDQPYDKMTDRAIRDVLRNDPAAYDRALQYLKTSGRDWNRVILSRSQASAAAGLIGLSVSDAAKQTGKTPAELVMEILREDAPGSLGAFGGMSDDNLKRILKQDWVCCGTDETARPADDSLGLSHPRGFGSSPAFIRILRNEGVPMSQIIRKLTSLPARIFKLTDRGVIRPGYYADLVIFKEEELDSEADFTRPHTPASGIRQVYVNGKAAYDGLAQKVTARAGRIA